MSSNPSVLRASKMLPFALLLLLQSCCVSMAAGRVAFEKMTEYDFVGTTYYTIQNLSLWECQGWCQEEPECAAASYSFVSNPLAPVQETLCLLQNETMAANPSAKPARAVSLYYMTKLTVRSDNVCNRRWQFERVPNRELRGRDNARMHANSKEDCLSACLNERRFVCRSAEYNYLTLQCHLSEFDRRTVGGGVALQEAQDSDYFENLCLDDSNACRSATRGYSEATLGMSSGQAARFVQTHYYVDKELMASTVLGCEKACKDETEFLCRSFLFKGPLNPANKIYNCQLFHLDHLTFPDGRSTFSSLDRPLLDDGKRTGKYYENTCGRSSGGDTSSSVVTSRPDLDTGSASGGLSSDVNCDPTGVCYDVSVHCKDTRIAVEVGTNKPFNGRIYALGRSETCNIAVINSDRFRLDLTMGGQDCNTQSANGVYTNTVVIQHHSVVMTKTDKIYKIRCTYDMSPKNITFGMMPIRDPDMIPITSAPEAPPPRIRILDALQREVETVRIGDRLTFRIEIPESTPYGIFARSCVAMAKDSRSTFKIIDDNGCPVEPAIFPQFVKSGSALQSMYDAFRFTESYGVIFQCNVKYCLGACEPARCQHGRDTVDSYGRKRRSVDAVVESVRSGRSVAAYLGRGHVQETTKEAAIAALAAKAVEEGGEDEEMSISQEILVLDLTEELAEDSAEEGGVMKDGLRQNATYRYTPPTRAVPSPLDTCPTRSSVLALAATCAVLLLTYLLTALYLVMRQWLTPSRKSMR